MPSAHKSKKQQHKEQEAKLDKDTDADYAIEIAASGRSNCRGIFTLLSYSLL
jgi:hypothetical protein